MKQAKVKRERVEFWISAQDKEELDNLCRANGYTIAEIMRRATEEKIEELKAKHEVS